MAGADRGKIMTEEERFAILEWVDSNIDNFTMLEWNRRHHIFIKDATSPLPFASTKQKLPPYTENFPTCIWKIKDRIIEKENLLNCNQDMLYQNFIGIILKDGFIHKHRDPNVGKEIHCRFNVFVELPKKGGETFYADKLIDSKEGHYVLCRSGLDEHWSNPVEEGRRISLSFGFLMFMEKLETVSACDTTSQSYQIQQTPYQ
jgi:hypothetical protein